MNRRGFLGVLTGVVAAPIVVRAGLIMPVKTPPLQINQLSPYIPYSAPVESELYFADFGTAVRLGAEIMFNGRRNIVSAIWEDGAIFSLRPA